MRHRGAHIEMHIPDNKVHGTNMWPIWGRQDPGGPHAGPMNFAIWICFSFQEWHIFLISNIPINTIISILYLTCELPKNAVLWSTRPTMVTWSNGVPPREDLMYNRECRLGTIIFMPNFENNSLQLKLVAGNWQGYQNDSPANGDRS